jgi:hypothetical protein
MTEAVSTPAPKPVEPPAEKPAIQLPVALVVSLVGAGLFLLGSFLKYYDIPGSTPKMFDSVSGKVAIILVLVGVLLVAVKKMQMIGAIAVSLALGAVLRSVIDVASGDDSVINLVNQSAGADIAKAGIGMYAAFFGAIICLLAVFMIPKKKETKKK